jgi:predicted DNA-binding protein (MmcQ/YjbR family)
MKYIDGIKYCKGKIGAKEDFIFNDKIQVFTVGGKQFCRVYEIEGKKSFALKADVELNIVLRQKYKGILVPQNMHNCYWNLVLLKEDVPDDEILFLIDLSYDLMFNSLTKNVQKELMDSVLL